MVKTNTFSSNSTFNPTPHKLIISEKPSVSASIAYCIGATEKISEGDTFYWQGNGYIVTNALGHLFGIGMPEDYGWESWELETLPLIPEEFKLFPLNGYGGQIKLLKKLISRDDVTEIINACDAGREGECIFRYIYNYFGCTKPTKRLWISSLTDESIKQGMKNLLDGKVKDNLFAAGFTRAKADWILGMSLSRLYSIVNDDSHKVGRVKTPVLNIVANRDEAIAAFTKRPFYKVVLGNGAECENVFDTAEQAEAVRAKCVGKIAVVSSSKTEQKKENRPLLHSLTSLQQEANDVYGMTAADTLKSAQSLYEKKHFTESTLLAVMENIDRLIDDKELKGFVKERGLGTPATRASIIEELISAGYIERKKKQLVSTDYGRAFAASVPDNVKSAELTAHWEQVLSDIENGNGNADMLLDEINNSVSEIIAFEKNRGSRVKVTRKVSVGYCPRCGSPVIENSKAFSCSAGRDKCGFFIFKQDKRIGRSYKVDEIAELLSKGKVTLKNCTSSKGNKYSAVFSLEDTGKYVNLKMEEFVGGKKKRGA